MAAVNLSSSVALLEKSTAAAKGVPSSSSSCSSSSIQGLPVLGRRHAHGRQRPLLVRGSAGKAPARRGAPIRTNAVATAPSTGVATWRSSGTSQAVPPAWSVLSEELSMGPCPRSPRDLDVLLANTKTTALLFLETEDGCDKLGLDWGKFRERASQKGLMAVRISMRDGDYQDQAAALPEAVRAVASLVALGYKVHVCCTSGVDRSPLVALGYLTFVKGMEFTDAVEIISANNQAAQPHFESWEEAKTRMAAGDLKRVSALAHEVAQHRVAAKQPGTPADDWLTAQQLLVAEAFDRGVATDVTLTEAISRVTRLEANRALEELAAFKANAEKAMEAANSSRDRLEFFNRQLQSLKDKEAEARLAMNAAVKDKEGLARQVQTLKLSEGSATKSAAEAREALAAATERVRGLEQREAEARAAAESATSKARDLALQVEKLRHAEAVARKELHGAKAKADFVATKLSSMEASLKEAQRAKDAANDRVKELLKNITSASTSPSDAKTLASKITELSSMETAASAAASIAKERVEFFQRQVIALKEREDATKELAQEALAKVSKLGEELEMTARREASAKEQVALLKTEVAQLSKQLQSLQMQGNTATAAASTGTASTDQTAEVQRLLAELEAAQKKASKATDAATYAQDQVQFFLRRIELLKEKEEKATKQAEERMAAFEARVVGKAQREIAERTAAVVKEMSAEVEAAKKISSKSLEQASTAKEQVQFFQRRMEMLKEREEKSKVATDARIRTFTLQVSELREKLAAADKAAAEADQKITNLSSQVAKLEVKEMAAIEAAKAAGERVHFFYRHIESLKEKEAAAKQAAADAQEQVKLLQKKVEALERKEEVAYAQASKYREKVAAFELSSMELEEELQMVKEREGKLMAALEDGSGVLKIAMEADETTKKLRKEAVKMAAELKDTQIRADRLASELEQALQAAGKKPRHWNDIEKSMFVAKGGGVQEMETQMKSQMTSMTQSMTASGTAVAVSGEADAQTAFLQNLVLGALGAAAVPFTLMSLFSTGGAGNPNVIGAMSQGQAGQTLTEQDAGGPAVEELLAGPIVKGTSPEEFCQTVPSGLRSARTDKFCNTLLEAAAMAE